MKPGRELDALVAEKVMGLVVAKCGGEFGRMEVFFAGDSLLRPYSTDMTAAQEVLEKMEEDGFHYFISTIGDWMYQVEFERGQCFQEHSTSVPHAICLAALRAVGALPHKTD